MSQASRYATVNWYNPKPSPNGDFTFCLKTDASIRPQQFSHDIYTVLRFFARRTENSESPIDYTVSFEGKILQSGDNVTAFDNVYVTESIRENSVYQFTLHAIPGTALSYATVDCNTHLIEIVDCSKSEKKGFKKASEVAAALIPIIEFLKIIYNTAIQPFHPHLPKLLAGDGERAIDVRKLLDYAQDLYDLLNELDKLEAEEEALSLVDKYEQVQADFLSVAGQLARAVVAKVERPETTT